MVTRDLGNQEAEEGATVSLHCELSKPGLLVEWRKGPALILTHGEKYHMVERGVIYELQISDLSAEDSGSYSCSSGGTVSSGSLVVKGRIKTMFIFSSYFHPFTIPPFFRPTTLFHCHFLTPHLMKDCDCCAFHSSAAPVVFTKELENQTAEEGDSVTLSCELSRAGAPLEWRRGELCLCPCAKYDIKQTGNLATIVIRDVDPEDSGNYTCDTGVSQSTTHLAVKGMLASNS